MAALRTTVLASGGGTNFQAVVDAVAAGMVSLDLRALVSNRGDAFALERARSAGVPAQLLTWDRKRTPRAEYDAALTEAVAASDPELLLLLGWMHVLPPQFVERFPRMINIHPAYLPLDPEADEVETPDGTVIPAFRGPHAIADALAAGSPWYGATAHRVGVEPDRGMVLARRPLRLNERDVEAALAALRPTEHAVLLEGIHAAIAAART
ncbi:MAG: phosphoribosylglycinamide formyltransferase [Candidatus Eremiobacteraeota bacterium]|nr:phosphoribosylglycinamide formyltransferase [Candidatus Eremiobacteraeota bacterium]MBV8356299.1 phosphoribosylglycinamide formyltransferase [Candidatus Eremiobacteraeota bacterium]